MGFGVWGFGFRISGFGFRALGFGFPVSGFEFPVSSSKFRVSGLGFRASGLPARPTVKRAATPMMMSIGRVSAANDRSMQRGRTRRVAREMRRFSRFAKKPVTCPHPAGYECRHQTTNSQSPAGIPRS